MRECDRRLYRGEVDLQCFVVPGAGVGGEYCRLSRTVLTQVSEGDVVNDLCQGPVDVITGVFSQKLALDLDDELLSAVLIGGRVNVYLPSRS